MCRQKIPPHGSIKQFVRCDDTRERGIGCRAIPNRFFTREKWEFSCRFANVPRESILITPAIRNQIFIASSVPYLGFGFCIIVFRDETSDRGKRGRALLSHAEDSRATARVRVGVDGDGRMERRISAVKASGRRTPIRIDQANRCFYPAYVIATDAFTYR